MPKTHAPHCNCRICRRDRQAQGYSPIKPLTATNVIAAYEAIMGEDSYPSRQQEPVQNLEHFKLPDGSTCWPILNAEKADGYISFIIRKQGSNNYLYVEIEPRVIEAPIARGGRWDEQPRRRGGFIDRWFGGEERELVLRLPKLLSVALPITQEQADRMFEWVKGGRK